MGGDIGGSARRRKENGSTGKWPAALLYEPLRHQALTAAPWKKAKARRACYLFACIRVSAPSPALDVF
jgi:hypothetical protein